MNNPPQDWCIYEEALATLAREAGNRDVASLILRLRKLFPQALPTELNLAVETYIARHEAQEKLGPWAREGFFSNALLQQASRVAIARARAEHLRGSRHVLEIGTGTGSDTAALAEVCGHVTSIDGDPIASELARRNLELQGIKNVTLVVGSAQEILPTLPREFDALFADPARRTQTGFRVKDGDDYSPPLSWILGLDIGSKRSIKISPGLFVDPCPEGWVRQFVGYEDECLEQTLWYGTKVKDSSIILADCGVEWAADPATSPCDVKEIGAYLVEAHATLNRCQYLDHFFASQGLSRFEPDVAYGTSDTLPPPSPLFTRYKVCEHIPFSLKKLKTAVTARGWSSRTELKKRSFSGDIEKIRRDLDLPKHTHEATFGVLFFFTYQGKPWCLLAERVYE